MNRTEPDLRVLVIEDNDDHAALLEQFLRSTTFPIGQLDRVADGNSGIRKAVSEEYDCVFLDFELPDNTGMDILAKLLSRRPQISVVMVTARGSEELAVEAMKVGAVDYLVKGNLTSRSLERALLGLLERNRLQTKVREQGERLMLAERHRGMMASLGAACHHFSQPVTSLMGRLELLLLNETDLSDRQKSLLNDCLLATRKMQELLTQFRCVEEFRTTPYLDDLDILDIESKPAERGSAKTKSGV